MKKKFEATIEWHGIIEAETKEEGKNKLKKDIPDDIYIKLTEIKE